MIRSIVAIDAERGFANKAGIPWAGQIPTDARYFHDQTVGSEILMGFHTYQMMQQPLSERKIYVFTHDDLPLRNGFYAVRDIRSFISDHPDVWVIGGLSVYAPTLSDIDELYVTQLDSSFGCDAFFPEFANEFILYSQTDPVTENGITYKFQVWRPNKLKPTTIL